MKRLLTLFGLLVVCSVYAQLSKINVLDGNPTNKTRVAVGGTNPTVVLNRVIVTNSFDQAASTNLGLLVRAQAVGVPAQNVGVAFSGIGSSVVMTNPLTLTFQRSMDTTNWLTWTNVTYTPANGVRVYTNYIFNIGDYHYVRCYDITNPTTGPAALNVGSLFLEFYFKK